jgi:hypothetical protein
MLGSFDESGRTWQTFASNALGNVLAFGFILLVLVLLRQTLWRTREAQPISPVIVVITGAVLGLTKVVISITVSWVLIGSVDPLNAPGSRFVGGALFGACALPLISLLLGVKERFRREREVLMAEVHHRSDVSTSEPRTFHIPDGRLVGLFSEIRQVISSHQDKPDVLRSALTRLIDKRLRPLTKELWISAEKRVTDFSGKDLLVVFFSRQTYLPGPTAMVLVVVTLPYVLSVVEVREGVARVLITAFLVWLVLHLLRLLPKATTVKSVFRLAGAIGAFTAANEIIAFALFGRFGDISAVFTSMGNASLVGLTSIVFGVSRVAWDDHQTVQEEIKRYLGPGYWEKHLEGDLYRAHQRSMAELLHGRVQNRLLGLVLSVDKSQNDFSVVELLRDVDSLEHLLMNPHIHSTNVKRPSLVEALANLSERWTGIIDVTYEENGGEVAPEHIVNQLLGLSEEAVTNAVRHGKATSIHIKITHTGQHLELVAKDNGIGPRNGKPGVGTFSLQRSGAQSWSLRPRKDISGSVLTVTMPLSSQRSGL